jgi:hypothetical protein
MALSFTSSALADLLRAEHALGQLDQALAGETRRAALWADAARRSAEAGAKRDGELVRRADLLTAGVPSADRACATPWRCGGSRSACSAPAIFIP